MRWLNRLPAVASKKPMPVSGSETSRADVKANAAASTKAGTAVKGGQESVKDQNKGGIPKQ